MCSNEFAENTFYWCMPCLLLLFCACWRWRRPTHADTFNRNIIIIFDERIYTIYVFCVLSYGAACDHGLNKKQFIHTQTNTHWLAVHHPKCIAYAAMFYFLRCDRFCYSCMIIEPNWMIESGTTKNNKYYLYWRYCECKLSKWHKIYSTVKRIRI